MFKKTLAMLLALLMVLSLVACGAAEEKPAETNAPAQEGEVAAPAETEAPAAEEPIKISMYYSDNPTLPYMPDWLAMVETAKLANIDLTVEAIPNGSDFSTKVSLALNTLENCPDVILYQETYGERASQCLNGSVVAISDYPEWTPNFNAMVEKLGLQAEVDGLALMDGKRYYMPALREAAQYDGGLILRADYLEAKGFDAPKTFDDLYEILKAYKEDYPESYPLTHLVAPYVTYRMTMPSFGAPFGKSCAPYATVLSWDYEAKDYFLGATSEAAREYLRFMNKLFDEGLLDPEQAPIIDDAVWSRKMTSGESMATYAYYDQIGGLEAASEIEGYDLQMYAPLEGPAGAHHQVKARASAGIMFPITTAERDDFEQVVRAVDKMFYSEEAAMIWHVGVEGVTYTMGEDGKIEFIDEIKNAPEGIFKYMQIKYGCGADPFQMVWLNDIDFQKYDEFYAELNAQVAAMDEAIQPMPPEPWFDDLMAEEAATIQAGLVDPVEVWIDAFVTGKKDVDSDADWAEYVAELEALGANELFEIYHINRNQG